jgi:hypothetical protein
MVDEPMHALLPELPETEREVAPQLMAAVLLCAAIFLRELELPIALSIDNILSATKVSKSRAYELKDALLRVLPGLLRPRGRPPSPKALPAEAPLLAVAQAVLDFLYSNPGAVSGGDKRRRYQDAFRRFVLELRVKYPDVALADFANAVRVPEETLQGWLRADGGAAVEDPTTGAGRRNTLAFDDEPKRRSVEQVLAAYKEWSGDFSSFCEHVRRNLLVAFGDTLIARILHVHGVRSPSRRAGRSPDELAQKGSFETFFPGAQWVGDGSTVPVVIDGQRIDVNLELDVDAHTAAFVGLKATAEEDANAVIETFKGGLETTGARPLALLLDNKPSNHAETVDQELGDATLRMRATTYRPQNKAHVEGGFGLFKRELPPLVVTTQSISELARQIVELVGTVFARCINHRSRSDRKKKSRAELYAEPVSDEQIREARARLSERVRLQELARATRLARLDPVVRAMLADAFIRLELADPDDHIKSSIARYPANVIAAGIGIFAAKRAAGTLPHDVDARYLLGIVRNIADKQELIALSTALVDERIRWRDAATKLLVAELNELERQHPQPDRLATAVALRALAAERLIDERFFLDALKKVILDRPEPERRAAFEHVARIVAVSFDAPQDRRQGLLVELAARLWPL